jgi:arylformamidase
VTLEPALSLAAGQGANVARLSLGTHTGTHVDAPAHLLPGGATVETLPLAALVGPAVVVEIGADPARDAAALLAAAGECPRLLLKRAPRCAAPAALSGALAARLAEAGLRLVGVDGPSVDAATTSPCRRTTPC